MTRTRRAALFLLTTAMATVGLSAVTAPAHAASPVTTDDAVSLYAGNAAPVEPLANDTDADGDDLAICRLGESSYKRVELLTAITDEGQTSDEELIVITRPRAKPGTYTFTYYACDFETLTPGTITVTVVEPPNITAKALPGKPGKIKVKNPADFKILFLYGSFENGEPDGDVRIPRNSSVILEVERTRIDWIALKARSFEYLKHGRVKDITLPPGTTPPGPDGPSSETETEIQRLLRWWRSAG
jgi:hypothetical protein